MLLGGKVLDVAVAVVVAWMGVRFNWLSLNLISS